MKNLNILIKKVKEIIADAMASAFSSNDDGFIDALGKNPISYEIVLDDGSVVYDADRALNDTAKEDWNDYV